MTKDAMGDRLKAYEAAEAKRRLDMDMPVIARIDGRSFSKFTRKFDKPFDTRLTEAMNRTTIALLEKAHANIGYTQSDEITLIWFVDRTENESAEMFFAGRVQKLCSVLAGITTAEFMKAMIDLGQKDYVLEKTPHFDCRVWNVPNKAEAANTLLWRYLDAKKNAVSIFARQYLSAKQMHGLYERQQLDAAYAAGAPRMDSVVDAGCHYGRVFKRRAYEFEYTKDLADELKSEDGIPAYVAESLLGKTITRHKIVPEVWRMEQIDNLVECIETDVRPTMKELI